MTCSINKIIFAFIVARILFLATSAFAAYIATTPQTTYVATPQTTFITETPEDIEEAYLNYPERVPRGPEVRTIAGLQISPGSLPGDFAKNREIYNDIQIIQNNMLELMQMIINIQDDPYMLQKARQKLPIILQIITNLGIRYNLTSEFNILRDRLKAYLAEVYTSMENMLKAEKSRNPDESAQVINFWVYRFNLEQYMAEITNKLRTKLVGV